MSGLAFPGSGDGEGPMNRRFWIHAVRAASLASAATILTVIAAHAFAI